MTPPQQALLHWVEEHRWDVWPISKVPPEMRMEGGLGFIPYSDGKKYLAKVVKISGSKKEMNAAETQLHKQIEEKKKEVPAKRMPTKVLPLGKKASTNDVRRAVGERSLPPSPLRKHKKVADAETKAKAALQRQVEEEEQEDLRKQVTRKLFPKSSGVVAESVSIHGVLSDDDDVGGDDSDDEDEDDNVTEVNTVTEAENDNVPVKDDDDGSEKSDDETDPAIKDFRNPNTEKFLEYLLRCFRVKQGSSSSSQSTKVYAKPIEQPGQKMVHLKKGHSLRIAKGSRNVLVLDSNSQKSASNFVRKTLVQLYGKEQLMEMTAVGRKKDSTCIPDQDLVAIYEFISEYTSSMPWNQFMRVVMRKCSATKASPNAKGTKQKSPKNNTSKKTGKETVNEEEEVEIANPKVIASPSKFANKVVVLDTTAHLSSESSQVRQHVVASPLKFKEKLVVFNQTSDDNTAQVNYNNSSAGQLKENIVVPTKPVPGHNAQVNRNIMWERNGAGEWSGPWAPQYSQPTNSLQRSQCVMPMPQPPHSMIQSQSVVPQPTNSMNQAPQYAAFEQPYQCDPQWGATYGVTSHAAHGDTSHAAHGVTSHAAHGVTSHAAHRSWLNNHQSSVQEDTTTYAIL